jgi:hypothetical protein
MGRECNRLFATAMEAPQCSAKSAVREKRRHRTFATGRRCECGTVEFGLLVGSGATSLTPDDPPTPFQRSTPGPFSVIEVGPSERLLQDLSFPPRPKHVEDEQRE